MRAVVAAERFLILCLFMLLASSVYAIQADITRGLEFHQFHLDFQKQIVAEKDSFALSVSLRGLSGFRDWNKEQQQIVEDFKLSWNRRFSSTLLWRTEGFQKLYNEKRFLRELLSSRLGTGLSWNVNSLNQVHLLGGFMSERRQVGAEQGPWWTSSWQSDYRGDQWLFDASTSFVGEDPGDRQNRHITANFDGRLIGFSGGQNRFTFNYQRRQEDFHPDPLSERLERRTRHESRLQNELSLNPLRRLRLFFLIDAWDRGLTKDQDETRLSSSDDQAAEMASRVEYRLGKWRGKLGLSVIRQRQDIQFHLPTDRRNLTRIQGNRLDALLMHRSQGDSLLVEGRLELRQRDSDFNSDQPGEIKDYRDLLHRGVSLLWSREMWPQARVGVKATWSLESNLHVQGNRSGNNYDDKRFLLSTYHSVKPLNDTQLHGMTHVSANYRLYHYDESLQARSYLQRRFKHREALSQRFPLTHGWQLNCDFSTQIIFEDGGSWQREAGEELLSDSATEFRVDSMFRFKYGVIEIAPGLIWYNHRDYEWKLEDGNRKRLLSRDLFRRGPVCEVRWVGTKRFVSLRVHRERVDDNGRHGGKGGDVQYWAKLSFRLDI
jgi:hypothetical protein